MALIVAGNQSTKPALVPISEKLEHNTFSTSRHMVWLTIQTLGMEHHLDPSKIPTRYESPKSKPDAAAKSTEAPTDSSSLQDQPQETTEYKEWRQNDLALATWLLASIGTTFKNKILNCQRFYEAWNIIINHFNTTSKTKVQSLKSQLKSVKKTGTITDYLAKIRYLVDSPFAIGYELQEDDHIQAIMDGLAEDYSGYITSVISRMGTFSVSEAESFLFAYEDMLEIFKSPSDGIAIANLSKSFLTGNGRGGGARRPRGGRFQRGGRSSFWNAPRPQCQICGIPGHVAWNCFYRFDQQFQPGSTSSGYSRQIPSASTEEYSKRNYADNVAEYNTVLGSLTAKRRHYLLRDAYDDMVLDGVMPNRDTFRSLVVGTMKGSRLQDAFFFINQMKTMGLVPDVTLYNFLISTCGKSRNSDQAVQILEEMKCMQVKPNVQTYICLLNACAADGRLDRVYAIVRDMTAAGLGLNKFCYAGLIIAHKNKTPVPDDIDTKVIEFVERSKMWSSVETDSESAENVMMGVTDEELYNLPTAEYVQRRLFLARPLTAYHTAFYAAADLKNVQLLETLLDTLSKDRKTPDGFIMMQIIRCHCNAGDIERARQTLEDYRNSGKPLAADLFVTLAEGAMVGYTEKGMQIAQDALVAMNQRNFSLNPRTGSDLLLIAAGEKTGGYTTANFIWDLMRARNVTPILPAVEAYYKGLKDREIPENDPRLLLVSQTYDNLRSRFGNRN